jgi:hypothetical protein
MTAPHLPDTSATGFPMRDPLATPQIPGMSAHDYVSTKPTERYQQMVHSLRAAAFQPWFLPALLVALSAFGSWEFACITPFVAFALTAAYALPTWTAVVTSVGIWAANQAVGFAVLGYPWDGNTFLWGIAIGAAAVGAAVLACAILRLAIRNRVVAVAAAFVMAFGAYEGGLFLVAFALGGREDFTPAIIGHVALLNLGWTVALIGTYEILRYARLLSGKPTAATPMLAASTR